MNEAVTVALMAAAFFVTVVILFNYGPKIVYSVVYMATMAYYRARQDYPHTGVRRNGYKEGKAREEKEQVHDHEATDG